MAKLLFVLLTIFLATNAESRDCNSVDTKGNALIYSNDKKVKIIIESKI